MLTEIVVKIPFNNLVPCKNWHERSICNLQSKHLSLYVHEWICFKLVGQYMLLRGEDRRRAEFPDLFTVDSLNEGVKGHVPMLCLRLGQRKVRLFSFILN